MLNIKRNDTVPLTATLRVAGAPIDLQGATVRFHMRDSAGTLVVDSAATVIQNGDGSDGTKGRVKYEWVASDPDSGIVGDTATAGVFSLEWEVTFADSTVRTFPTTHPTKLKIWGDLA